MQLIDSASALLRLHEIEFSDKRIETSEVKKRKKIEIERCKNELSSEILHRYSILKKRYGNSAVVLMENHICKGCYISLPQSIEPIEGEIYLCEHCGRLLIDSDEIFSVP